MTDIKEQPKCTRQRGYQCMVEFPTEGECIQCLHHRANTNRSTEGSDGWEELSIAGGMMCDWIAEGR